LPARQVAAEAQRQPLQEDLKPTALSAAGKESAPDQISHDPLAPSLPAGTDETFKLIPRSGDVLTGTLPLDLPRVNASVERFFTRMEDLGEELAGWHLPVELAPWLASMAAALAASECVRWQRSRQRASVGDDGGDDAGPVFSAWTLLVTEDDP
jgi:hypothetical protein